LSRQIDINVTGGNANFETIIQGDHIMVHSGGRQGLSLSNFDELRAAVAGEGEKRGVSSADLRELQQHIAEIEQSVNRNADGQGLANKLHAIYDKFSWAAPLIKGLLAQLAPGLLGGISS
jgi:hypothetical protein